MAAVGTRLLWGKPVIGATLVLGSFGLVRGTHSERPFPRMRLSTDEPVVQSDVPRVSFFAVGDTGWPSQAKADVEGSMAAKARVAHPDFVALLGDNFYSSGVTSTHNPLWRTHFEEAYAVPKLDVPFPAVLGNHDHGGSIQAQVEYGHLGTRWKMDGFHYAFSHSFAPAASVDFFALDVSKGRP